MIHTDEDYKNEALVFFKKKGKYLDEIQPFAIEDIALIYVKRNKDFKYGDPVDAGALVRILVDFDFIKFIKRENDIRYHALTKKGIKFIKDQN